MSDPRMQDFDIRGREEPDEDMPRGCAVIFAVIAIAIIVYLILSA